ncbi:Hypothetical protein MPV1_5 [Marinitoga phage MPV1]|uniref:Uncharacterized protein n=1 Tax=Marinitoga piezophila (strain DSM 14283 / JCM 11233 / KA3) TaxID=443254 RepID=H2J427_MARPK|nr:hypothetical protein [Marinitoga piezophila]AEX84755.1 hypothetical protein Marpi_0304 [Marinitoga piezophila KA3]
MDFYKFLDDLIDLHFKRYNLSHTKYAKIIDKKIIYKYKLLKRALMFESFADKELIDFMDSVIENEWVIDHEGFRKMDNRVYVLR